MTQIVDAAERALALDPEQSFIVSAPAGSGKTGLITQRVLRLLCTVESPEQILSITFTRKAAGEMASRIHNALQFAAYNPRPDNDYDAQTWDLAAQVIARDSELGWNLLTMPGRLRIQTIDGFCRYIASQFALETKFGTLPDTCDQPAQYYQSAARAVLENVEEDSATGLHVATLLAHMGNNWTRCETVLAELLGKREQWLPLIVDAEGNQAYFQQVIDDIVSENLLQLQEELQPIAGEFIALADFAASHVSPDKNARLSQLAGISDLPDISADSISEWKVLLNLLVTKEIKPRKKITVSEGFPTDHKSQKQQMLSLLEWSAENRALQELISNVMHLPDTKIASAEQTLLDALGHLLPLLAAELSIQFSAHDTADYPAITLAALDGLGPSAQDESISDITLRLDYQLRHILVDEFQDTSASQIKLLEQVIAGWEQGDGRTLFLVGDAMQSLYSFRNANVGLFLNAQRHPIGPIQCQPLTLRTNFRSQQGIVEWVNHTFAKAFPAHADIGRGAIPYSASQAFKRAGEEAAVSFQGFSGEGDRLAEAQSVAQLCTKLVAEKPQESIAILVRGRGHLSDIVPALAAAKLSWQAIDITPLAARMPVVDVLSLTRALRAPADKIAWLSVLRAPFCGFGLADLLVLANPLPGVSHPDSAQSSTVERDVIILSQLQDLLTSDLPNPLSESGQVILKRTGPLLVTAWNNRLRGNLRDTIEQLWLVLGGPATLSSSADLDDVRRYFDLLETWQEAGTIKDWQGFQAAVDQLYAAPSVDSPISQEAQPIIQIMTIHKAKGLEFDHVILPGLSRTGRSNDKPLLRWQQHINEEGQASLIMSPLGAHDEDDSSVYRYLSYEEGVKSRLENTRVLYVAATRAIRKLYLFGSVTTKKNVWQVPSKGTLLARIWETIEPAIDGELYQVTQLDDSDAAESPATQAQGVNPLKRLASDYQQHQKVIRLALGAELSATDTTLKTDAELSMRARHLGTLLHRSLKQIAQDGLEKWPQQRLQQLPSAWTAQLKELGILSTDTELSALSQAIRTMLSDSRGQWILQSHTDAHCEQALGYRYNDQSGVGTSVIDRTFIDQGIRWIIDYKFSHPNDGETVEQFAARQSQLYTAQLNHYATLYREMQPTPVRCALYFPQIPLFVEVPVE